MTIKNYFYQTIRTEAGFAITSTAACGAGLLNFFPWNIGVPEEVSQLKLDKGKQHAGQYAIAEKPVQTYHLEMQTSQ